MANLSAVDMRIIEDTFGSTSGYVMDLSTPAFGVLFRKEVGVDIMSGAYETHGTSKGKRFRAFLEEAPDPLVLKALGILWDYRLAADWKSPYLSPEEHQAVEERFLALMERKRTAKQTRPGAEADAQVVWLARVSRQLRRITMIAMEAFEASLEDEQKQAPEGTREKLQALYEGLVELIPEDFPASAIGDMARHMRFSESGDCRDIVRFDAPDILMKAEKLAVYRSREQQSDHDVRNLVHEIFRRKLVQTLKADEPDYHGLVLQCSVILADWFRNKTGMPDEMGAIGKAFSPKDPVLMVPSDLDTETNRNYQQGAMYLFQGYRAYFRNTHAHGITDTDERLAVHALMLFSLLADILDASRRVDDA